MSTSDDDSHVLPNQASSDDDEDDDSEDETLEPLVRLHDGKNLEPVVVAEVVPDATWGTNAEGKRSCVFMLMSILYAIFTWCKVLR